MVELIILPVRIILGLVFALAGFTKLTDLKGSRQAMADFGLPAALTNPAALMLTLAELVIAVTLLPTRTAWWAAWGALGLLLLFLAGITFNLARGRKPACHCFGQLYSEPVGVSTLVRNLFLAGLAVLIINQGGSGVGPSGVAWLVELTLAEKIIVVAGLMGLGVAGVLAWLIKLVLLQNGRLLLRLEALEKGHSFRTDEVNSISILDGGQTQDQVAPPFALVNLQSETLTLVNLLDAQKPVILIFTDPNCGPCQALLPYIEEWQQQYFNKLTIALISVGTPEVNRSKFEGLKISNILLQQNYEVTEAYGVQGTPSAVLVQPNGTTGGPPQAGVELIQALVAYATRMPLQLIPKSEIVLPGNNRSKLRLPLKIGELAPDFSHSDLKGELFCLKQFRGRKILVLFWNTGCGFCNIMLDDLKAWEQNQPPGVPELLLISTGSILENQMLGLNSTILLDPDFITAATFGINGTPIGVIVDQEGRIASMLAEGAPAVFALAGKEPAIVRE